MIDNQIGTPTNNCTAMCMRLNLQGVDISENRDEYWVTVKSLFNLYIKINKDTDEGKFISNCVLGSNLITLEEYLENLGMRFITVEGIKQSIEAAYDRGYDSGVRRQQQKILSVLGINY